LNADLGGFVGGAGNLIRTGRNLTSGIASSANQFLQAVGHAQEGIAEVSRLERGTTSTVKSPSATAMETLAISFK